MKRSEINFLVRSAQACFDQHGWALPPEPRWDVTDFGLSDWKKCGLVLINLADEPEYCEKLMYARKGMMTIAHTHRKKKEDIICRWGTLAVRAYSGAPDKSAGKTFEIPIIGQRQQIESGEVITLQAGSRVTLVPGIYHEFWSDGDECIIGEVSTANNDLNDNIFVNPDVGRYPTVEEDEPAIVRLLSDR